MKNEIIVKGKITIEGMTFTDIEGGFGEGKKAMLLKDIAEIHERDLKDINRNINNNRNRFKDGVDIIDFLSGFESLRKIADENGWIGSNRTKNVYLLSERGYAKLLKILEDDKAWEQYEKLVDGYFDMRAKFKTFYKNLSPEVRAIFAHDQRIRELENRFDVIENTMTIDYGQQLKLQTTANKMCVNFLGGKESAAYNQVSKKVFQSIWADYKRYFNIESYKDTPTVKFEEAKHFLSNWHPKYEILVMIRDINFNNTSSTKYTG